MTFCNRSQSAMKRSEPQLCNGTSATLAESISRRQRIGDRKKPAFKTVLATIFVNVEIDDL